MSVAVTRGIKVAVKSQYLANQSNPSASRYVFAYTVTISNEGGDVVQLKARHWTITDATGKIEEVRGEGVVGEQPVLRPQQSFQYTSGCILKTPWGTMSGTYQMFKEDGARFEAVIAPFLLATPFAAPGGAPN